MSRTYRLGLALVTGSAVAWSLAGFFTRLIPLDSWTLLAWRGIFGGLGIALVILAMEGRQTWRSLLQMGWPGLAFAIVSAIGMVCFITALRHSSVAHVAVIYALAPFLAAALGWLAMGELPSRNAVATSILALAGVCRDGGIERRWRRPGRPSRPGHDPLLCRNDGAGQAFTAPSRLCPQPASLPF